MNSRIAEKISRLRRECIINRILYYVFNEARISDYEYDMNERELRNLCDDYPNEASSTAYCAICPTLFVGSDSESDYPPELVGEAKKRI